jgi:spore coat polysaccharide biosynthesis protein SpsF
MKTLVILQARMSSSRLPGKVMAQINGRPMIYWQIQRISQCPDVDKLITATSEDVSDDKLFDFLFSMGVEVSRGSLEDVHSRFLKIIMEENEFENVVRLTGDCPLTMPELLGNMISEFKSVQLDYYSNCNPPTYPDGLDIEIFSRTAFLKMSQLVLTSEEKEHVTLRFRKEPGAFRQGNKVNSADESNRRWTVDFEEDLAFVRRIFTLFKSRENEFTYSEVIDSLALNPSLENTLSGRLRNIALRAPLGNQNEQI